MNVHVTTCTCTVLAIRQQQHAQSTPRVSTYSYTMAGENTLQLAEDTARKGRRHVSQSITFYKSIEVD